MSGLSGTDKLKYIPSKLKNKSFEIPEELDWAYGATFRVIDSKQWLADFENVKAKHKVQIRVIIDGEKKEFTFDEFRTLLGFSDPELDARLKAVTE